MRLLLLPLLLAGCAVTPQEMASRSNWDVCRSTMGGPNAQLATQEAARRSLDCAPLYPAIAAQMQNQNAATANFINSLNRPAAPRPPMPVHCNSYRVGNQVNTNCW
jgi:hypothetical protein